MNELAAELGIAVSSLQGYIDGTAEKTHTPIAEMVSGPVLEWKRAETILRAAVEFSDFPAEKRKQGIQLFLQLVALFAKET